MLLSEIAQGLGLPLLVSEKLTEGLCDFPEKRIIRTPESLIFEFATPGYCKEDIRAEIRDDCLEISTTNVFDKRIEKSKLADDEKLIFDSIDEPTRFAYKFHLPNGIDYDNIVSTYKDGILTIKLNFIEKMSKKIDIKTEE